MWLLCPLVSHASLVCSPRNFVILALLGMTRDDLFNVNASIVANIAQTVATACPKVGAQFLRFLRVLGLALHHLQPCELHRYFFFCPAMDFLHSYGVCLF